MKHNSSPKIWNGKSIPENCDPESYDYQSENLPVYPNILVETGEIGASDSHLSDRDGVLYFDLSGYGIYEYPLRDTADWLETDVVNYYIDDVIIKLKDEKYEIDIEDIDKRDILERLVIAKIREQMIKDIDEMRKRIFEFIHNTYINCSQCAARIDIITGQIQDIDGYPFRIDELIE